MQIEFKRKFARFLSDFDQSSVPNLIDLCSKSERNLNFCQKQIREIKILGFPENRSFFSIFQEFAIQIIFHTAE